MAFKNTRKVLDEQARATAGATGGVGGAGTTGDPARGGRRSLLQTYGPRVLGGLRRVADVLTRNSRAKAGKPGETKSELKPGSTALKPPDAGGFTKADEAFEEKRKLLELQYQFGERSAQRQRKWAQEDKAEERAYQEAQKQDDRNFQMMMWQMNHGGLGGNIDSIDVRTGGKSFGSNIKFWGRHRVKYRNGGALRLGLASMGEDGDARFGPGSTGKGYKVPEKRDDRFLLRQGWMPKDMFVDKDGKRKGDYTPADFGIGVATGRAEPGGRFQGGYLDPQYRDEYIRYRMEGYDPADKEMYGRARDAAEESWNRLQSYYDRRFRMYGEEVLRMQNEAKNGKAASPDGPGAMKPPRSLSEEEVDKAIKNLRSQGQDRRTSQTGVVKDIGLDAFDAYAAHRFGPRELHTYSGSDVAAKMHSKKTMESQARDAWVGARFAQQRRNEDARVDADVNRRLRDVAARGLSGDELKRQIAAIDTDAASRRQGPMAAGDIGRPSAPKPSYVTAGMASASVTPGEQLWRDRNTKATGREVAPGRYVFGRV